MGDVILLFNTNRPQRVIELSNETHMASRTLAESSPRSLRMDPSPSILLSVILVPVLPLAALMIPFCRMRPEVYERDRPIELVIYQKTNQLFAHAPLPVELQYLHLPMISPVVEIRAANLWGKSTLFLSFFRGRVRSMGGPKKYSATRLPVSRSSSTLPLLALI